MLMFIFYIIASAALSVLAAFTAFGGYRRFWAAVVHGTIMLSLALWLFLSMRVSIMWLVWFTVANALGSGALEVFLARAMRRHLDSNLLAWSGVISLAAAILLTLIRNSQMSSIVSALGIYAIFSGAVLLAFSLRLLMISRHLHVAHIR
jgi:uncharacterized membrane protein HdeD (DUF308 family)